MGFLFNENVFIKTRCFLLVLYFLSAAHAELKQENLELLATSHQFEKPLFLRSLVGGGANAPAYVYAEKNGIEVPLGVFKRERESEIFSVERFTLLEKMKNMGFCHLPNVIKNARGEYLTKIDGNHFYCIEYLLADPPTQENSASFSLMLKLIGSFHAYAQKLSVQDSFHMSKIDHFKKRMHFFSDEFLIKTVPDLFDTAIWKKITHLSRFYSTSAFEEIYNTLPRQVLHGDSHLNNIIISNKIPYFIDFDEMRFDVRLWDLACCILSNFFDEFLEKMKNGSLFSFVESNYEIDGIKLQDSEKEYLFEMVMFRQLEGMAWMLEMVKWAITNDQPMLFDQFKERLTASIYRIERLIALNESVQRWTLKHSTQIKGGPSH